MVSLSKTVRLSGEGMDNASGLTNTSSPPDLCIYKPLTAKVLLVQVLAGVFFYVNVLMIFTFFRKEAFRSDTRYILFAHMLLVDSSLLATTDLAVLLMHFQCIIPYTACMVLNLLMIWLEFCTPLTLVAMCLERYVAICKPLQYANISTPKTRLIGLFLIWGLASVPAVAVLLSFGVLVPASQLSMWVLTCHVESVIVVEWQRHLQAAVYQFYFLVMTVVIAFTYVKITVAARAASGDNKKSTSKGVRTVVLHAIQLLLCLIQLWSPFLEMSLLKVNFVVYIEVRFFNFVVFMIAPRCLSPLIYGLRDQKFYQVLKYYAAFGLNRETAKISAAPAHFVSVVRLGHIEGFAFLKRR
ncbi:olfactory receptor 4K17-like [Arapaima gigas]